jgi:hypothetical protein
VRPAHPKDLTVSDMNPHEMYRLARNFERLAAVLGIPAG